jgi:adenylate cyclase
VNFPILFHTVSHNTVSNNSYAGHAIDLSYNGLQARLPIKLEILSDIRIILQTSLMSEKSSHIYARILNNQKKEDGWISRMEFTGIDDKGQAAIKNYIDQSISRR